MGAGVAVGIGIEGRSWMRFAETEPSLLVVPDTMMVEPVVTSESEPVTLLETVVFGVTRTTCEEPSRVLIVIDRNLPRRRYR